MQPKFEEILKNKLEEECPEVLDILNGPHGDWHLTDAKELFIQVTIALQEAYKLGRLHEKTRCAEVLDYYKMLDASDIIRDMTLND